MQTSTTSASKAHSAFDANGLYVHNCGEQPLPSYGCCCLGSINLTLFVADPFTPKARFDFERVRRSRASGRAHARQRARRHRVAAAAAARRGDEQAPHRSRLHRPGRCADHARAALRHRRRARHGRARSPRRCATKLTRRRSSSRRRKARFRCSTRNSISPRRASPRACPSRLKDDIAQARHAQQPPAVDRADRHHLARVRRQRQPTASSRRTPGPISARSARPTARTRSTTSRTMRGACTGTAAATWTKLPPQFVTALEISALDHMRMVAAVAPFVDSAISKTVNVPEDYPYDDFKDLYLEAWKAGLKGITTYRPNAVLGSVLSVDSGKRRTERSRHVRHRPPHPPRSRADARAVEPALAGPAAAAGRQSVVDLHGRIAVRPVRDLRRPRRERRAASVRSLGQRQRAAARPGRDRQDAVDGHARAGSRRGCA